MGIFTNYHSLLKWHTVQLILISILVLYTTPSSTAYCQPQNNSAPLTTVPHDNNIIQLGILPYLSTKALINQWQDFAEQLGKQLQKKVIIKTAPSYAQFITRTAQYRYDIIMSAPHFAVLAQIDSNYTIIAGFDSRLSGAIFVLNNSPYKTLQDLRGQTLTTPDRLAAITILGELTLQQAGLKWYREITIKNTPSHNNALLSVIKRQSAAGIAVKSLYLKTNKTSKKMLRLLTTTAEIPHTMFIVSPKISKKSARDIKNAFLNIKLNKILSRLKWGNLKPVSSNNINKLLPLIPLLKARLMQ